MKIADLKNAGWLIGHNPDPAVPIPGQKTPAVALLRGYDDEGRALIEATGNLNPAVHYKTRGPGDDRDHAYAWSWGMPAVSTQAYQPQEAPAPDPNARLKTTTRGPKAAPAVRTLPIRSKAYDPDTRFLERPAALPADAPGFPKGTPGLVVHALQENEEGHELFLPIRDGRLIAANAAGSPALSTRVYDLRPDDSIDPDRRAPLHSMMRVVKGVGLAWQQTGGGRDDASGYGLIIGRPGSSAEAKTDSTSTPRPESSSTAGTTTPAHQVGGAVNIQELEQKLQDEPLKPGNNGGVTVIGPTQTRPKPAAPAPAPATPGSTTKKPPDPVKPPNLSGLVAAYTSHERGGPIDVGGEEDAHFLGFTGDNEPINSAHLHTDALFRAGKDKDASLEFDTKKPYKQGQPGAFNVPVTLQHDDAATHPWMGSEKKGRWRWSAKVPFVAVPDGRKPPPKPEPPKGPIGSITGPVSYPPGGGGGGGGGGAGGSKPTGVIGNGTPFTSTGGTTQGGKAVIDDGPPVALTPTDENAWAAGCPKNGQAVTGQVNGTQVRDPCPTFPCLKVNGELVIGTRPTAAGLPDPTKGDPRCAERTQALIARSPDAVVITGYGTNPTGLPDGWDYTTKPSAAAAGTSDGGGMALSPAGDTATVALGDGMSLGFGEKNEDRTEAGIKDGVQVDRDPDDPNVITLKGVDATGAFNGEEVAISLAAGLAGVSVNGVDVGAGASSLGAEFDTGDESDGDVTIGADTEETNPQYGNLTIDAGFSLTGPAGSAIYARATGDVQIDGTFGGAGRGPLGGAGGAGSAGKQAGASDAGSAGQQGAAGTYASASGGAGGGGSGGVDGDTAPFPTGGAGGPGADGRDGTTPHPTNGGTAAPGGAALAGEGHGNGPGSAATAAASATHLDDDYANEAVASLPMGAPGSGGGGGSGGSTDGTATTGSGGAGGTPARPNGGTGTAGTGSVNMAGGGGGGAGGAGGAPVAIDARGNVTISATGAVRADGGNGGDGGAGGENDGGALGASGGGGGGGSAGGGSVARVRHGGTFTNSGAFSADAGNVGSFGAGGDVGLWDGGNGNAAAASAGGHAFSVQMS